MRMWFLLLLLFTICDVKFFFWWFTSFISSFIWPFFSSKFVFFSTRLPWCFGLMFAQKVLIQLKVRYELICSDFQVFLRLVIFELFFSLIKLSLKGIVFFVHLITFSFELCDFFLKLCYRGDVRFHLGLDRYLIRLLLKYSGSWMPNAFAVESYFRLAPVFHIF